MTLLYFVLICMIYVYMITDLYDYRYNSSDNRFLIPSLIVRKIVLVIKLLKVIHLSNVPIEFKFYTNWHHVETNTKVTWKTVRLFKANVQNIWHNIPPKKMIPSMRGKNTFLETRCPFAHYPIINITLIDNLRCGEHL